MVNSIRILLLNPWWTPIITHRWGNHNWGTVRNIQSYSGLRSPLDIPFTFWMSSSLSYNFPASKKRAALLGSSVRCATKHPPAKPFRFPPPHSRMIPLWSPSDDTTMPAVDLEDVSSKIKVSENNHTHDNEKISRGDRGYRFKKFYFILFSIFFALFPLLSFSLLSFSLFSLGNLRLSYPTAARIRFEAVRT